MAENKVNEIFDIAALQKQFDFVSQNLNKIAEQMAKLSKTSITNKEQFKGAEDLSQLNEAQKQYADTTQKTQAVLKENEKLLKQKIDLEAKLLAAQSEQAKANAKIKDEITKQNAANKDLAKGMMAAADSIVAQRLRLKELTKEYNSLSKAQRESEAGQEQLKTINSLSSELLEAEKSMGNFTRQVGNYELAGKAMTQELKATVREMAAMKMVGADVLEPELFAELSEKAGELKDTIEGAREEMNFFASDTKNIDGIINGIEGVVGAWGAVQGAMALVGGENKELEETFTKLQGIMTVIQSLQAVQNALQKESAFNMLASNIQRKIQVQLTLLEEKATKGNIIQKTAATVAQKALNLAMSMSPFGMLIAGVAALSIGYLALSSYLAKKSKAQRIDNEVIKSAAENSAQERVELGLAVAKIKEAQKGRGDLTKAIDDYNEKFGETGKLTKEIVADEKLFNDIILKQTQIIMLRARAEAYKEKIIEIEKENIRVQTEGVAWYKEAWNMIKNGGNIIGTYKDNIKSMSEEIQENNKTIEWAARVHLALTQQIEGMTVAKEEDTKETKKSEAAYIDWAKRIFEITQELRQSQLDLLKESREKEKGENQIKFEQEIYDLEERMKKEPKLRSYYEKIIENNKEEHRQKVAAIDEKWDLEAEKRVKEHIDLQIEAVKTGTEEEIKLQIDANNKARDIEIKETERTAEEIILIKQKYAKKEAEIRSQFIIDQAGIELQKRTNAENEILETELKALDKQLKNKEIDIEEYNKKKLEIEKKYADLSLNNQILILEAEIAMMPEGSEKKLELEQQLIDKKKELYEKDRENFIENEEHKAEKEKEIREAAAESFSEIQNSLVEFTNQQFESKLMQLDEEQRIQDENLAKDLERAGTNENYKAELQKRADAQTKKRAEERRKIELQQAKFEKANALFQAIIGTAKEVAKNAANPVLVALALATGAAQITAIAAQPIPKYAKGRKGGKSEIAMVGEAGAEAVIYPNKDYKIFDSPTVTYLPSGADVLTAKETANIFAKPNLQSYEINSKFANNIIDMLPLQTEIKALRNDIKNKEHVSINVNESGFNYILQRGNNITKFRNGLKYNG